MSYEAIYLRLWRLTNVRRGELFRGDFCEVAVPSPTRAIVVLRGGNTGINTRTVPDSLGNNFPLDVVDAGLAVGRSTRTTLPCTRPVPRFFTTICSRFASTIRADVCTFALVRHQLAIPSAVVTQTVVSEAIARARCANAGKCSGRDSSCE